MRGSYTITLISSLSLSVTLMLFVVFLCLTPLVSNRRLTYKFDGDLLVIQEVCSLEDHTKRTLSDFLTHTVVNADDIGG